MSGTKRRIYGRRFLACLLIGFLLLTGLLNSVVFSSGGVLYAHEEDLPAVRNLSRYSAMSGGTGLGYMLEIIETPAAAAISTAGRVLRLTGKSGLSLVILLFFAMAAVFIYFARYPDSVTMQLRRSRLQCLMHEKDGMK